MLAGPARIGTPATQTPRNVSRPSRRPAGSTRHGWMLGATGNHRTTPSAHRDVGRLYSPTTAFLTAAEARRRDPAGRHSSQPLDNLRALSLVLLGRDQSSITKIGELR
jgi:hypothetical protein